MACGGCKKHAVMPVASPDVNMANSLNAGSTDMSAGDMVWVQLIDRNIGAHPISFSGTNYGYRSDGDRFKMIRAHAELDMRVIMVEQDLDMVPSVEPDPLPEAAPPPQYAEWAKEPEPEPTPEPVLEPVLEPPKTVVQDFEVMKTVAGGPGAAAQVILDSEDKIPEPMPVYDLTEIWGITEDRETKLIEMGVRSPQAIVGLGETMIARRLDVTETVAKRIIKSAANF